MRIESRTCIKCGEVKDIPQKHKHATNTCVECQREASKHYQREASIREGKRIGFIGRVPYPLSEGHSTTGNYFKSLASNIRPAGSISIGFCRKEYHQASQAGEV